MRLTHRCLELADRSRSDIMRFGTVLVRSSKVLGEGWNRSLGRDEWTSTATFPFPVCPWSIHSEQDAIYKALKAGHDVTGARLYCLGFFSDTRKVYISRTNLWTCSRCWRLMEKLKIVPMRFSSNGRWEKATIFKPETRFKCVVEHRRRINVNRDWIVPCSTS